MTHQSCPKGVRIFSPHRATDENFANLTCGNRVTPQVISDTSDRSLVAAKQPLRMTALACGCIKSKKSGRLLTAHQGQRKRIWANHQLLPTKMQRADARRTFFPDIYSQPFSHIMKGSARLLGRESGRSRQAACWQSNLSMPVMV